MSARGREDRGKTAAVLQQAINNFEHEGGQATAFTPAATFQGARPGYTFGTGARGTGYYADNLHASSSAPPSFADDDQPGPSRPRSPARPVNPAELLAEAEAAAGDGQVTFVDAKALKKLAAALERKYNHNVEQRAKHADEPQRFLESEIELDEAVKAMLPVATSPELYPDLVASGCVPTLLALLHHENGDIAADAIELLSELTDAEAVEEAEEEAAGLVDALLAGGLLEALAQRLAVLDEGVPEEAAAVYNALAVVENAAELRAEAATAAATRAPLLQWMLRRLRPRAPADANKQYAAEVLAVVLQAGGDAARKRFVELGGVDSVLQAVAPYRNKDSASVEEEELVENLFDALCVVLLLPEAQRAFVAAEGVELMLLVLRARRGARGAALKALDFATTRCSSACDRVVDQGGLKTLFALLMGKLKARGAGGKKPDEAALEEEEERCVSVVANLMAGVTGQARRDRLAAKFVENEFEKCDRLMEIFARYEARVEAAAAAGRRQEPADDEDDEDDSALRERLSAGLFTLQRCALVAATLWACGDAALRRRLLGLLHQRGRTLGALRSVLLEYRASLGGGGEGGGEEEAQQIEDATHLLAAVGHQDGEQEMAPGAADGGEAGKGEKRPRSEDGGAGNEQAAQRPRGE